MSPLLKLILITFILAMPLRAFAYADAVSLEESGLSQMSEGRADRSADKLGRGLENLFFGWLEIPVQIAKASSESNAFVGVPVGLVKGLGWTVTRIGVGFFEFFTFPFPGEQILPLLGQDVN